MFTEQRGHLVAPHPNHIHAIPNLSLVFLTMQVSRFLSRNFPRIILSYILYIMNFIFLLRITNIFTLEDFPDGPRPYILSWRTFTKLCSMTSQWKCAMYLYLKEFAFR